MLILIAPVFTFAIFDQISSILAIESLFDSRFIGWKWMKVFHDQDECIHDQDERNYDQDECRMKESTTRMNGILRQGWK